MIPSLIAPPVNPILIPNAVPIPSIAIPIVAIVDQLLPVARETIEHIIQLANKNIDGESKSIP
jgi:hypothetical protein